MKEPGWADVTATASGVVFSARSPGQVHGGGFRHRQGALHLPDRRADFAPPTSYMLDGRQDRSTPAGLTATVFAVTGTRGRHALGG